MTPNEIEMIFISVLCVIATVMVVADIPKVYFEVMAFKDSPIPISILMWVMALFPVLTACILLREAWVAAIGIGVAP